MGRKFKMMPNTVRTQDPDALAKRKDKTMKRARRRGTVAQLAWDAGAQPASTARATFSAK